MNTIPCFQLARRNHQGTSSPKLHLLGPARCISPTRLRKPPAPSLPTTALPCLLFDLSPTALPVRPHLWELTVQISGPSAALAVQPRAPAHHTQGPRQPISHRHMTAATAVATTLTTSARAGWIGHYLHPATQAILDLRASNWSPPWSTAGDVVWGVNAQHSTTPHHTINHNTESLRHP